MKKVYYVARDMHDCLYLRLFRINYFLNKPFSYCGVRGVSPQALDTHKQRISQARISEINRIHPSLYKRISLHFCRMYKNSVDLSFDSVGT